MPNRYVLIRIPKTGTTWMDEVTWRLDGRAMRRKPFRGALRIDILGKRRVAICPARENYPLSVFAGYQYDRLIRKMILVNNMVVPRPHKSRTRDFLRNATGRVEKHVPWTGLPEWMHEFPVVTVLRDVLSWHLSRWLYITSFPAAYQYWQFEGVHPDNGVSRLPARKLHFLERWLDGELSWSSWGNLSAEAYWDFTHNLNLPDTFFPFLGFRPQWPSVGFYTMRIVMMLHRDPRSVFRLSEPELEEYFASGRWRGDICPGWFLRQERLVEDAHRVLVGEIGYRREDLEQVLAGMPERLNEAEVGRRERARQKLYGNEALCAEILHAERFAHRYLLPGLTEEVSTAAAPPPPRSSSSSSSRGHGNVRRSPRVAALAGREGG